jgi:hypothetical protein
MKTSYFSRSGRHPNAIAICRGIPKWFKGQSYQALAPSWALVKESNIELYRAEYYRTVLSLLNPKQVIDDLYRLSTDPILLCYEKPGEFCHRHEVAKWLMESVGYEVEELS